MTKAVLVAFLFLFSRVSGAPVIVTDPEKDFVSSPGTEDESYLPKSDEIYRLDLRLYGEKKPTVFLTYRMWGSKSGNTWVAYVPTKGGYNRIDNTTDGNKIVFRDDGFYRTGAVAGFPESGGIYVLYPGKGGANLGYYDIRNGKASYRAIRSIDYSKTKDMKFAARILGHWIGDRNDDVHNPAPQTLSASEIQAASSH